MRKYLLLIATSFWTLLSFSQNHIPSDGENIIFYPLTNLNTFEINGYDCFYNEKDVIRKNKYKFKPKFRFKKNDEKVTPITEIEGYAFYVKKTEVLNPNKDKETLLLFLERKKDKENIILRIPWRKDKKSNDITNSFLSYKKISFFETRVSIQIPYINYDTLAQIKKDFIGTEIRYKPELLEKNSDILKQKEQCFESLTNRLNENKIDGSYRNDLICKNIFFCQKTNSILYMHPYAECEDSYNKKTIKIPITSWEADSESCDINYKTENYLRSFFETKQHFRTRFFRENNLEKIDSIFSRKQVYYGLKSRYIYENGFPNYYNADYNRVLSNDSLYVLTEGVYECIKFDIYEFGLFRKIFAILKDKNGVEFKVPATYTNFGTIYEKKECEDFINYFILNEEAEALKKELIQKAQKEAAEREYKYNKLVASFGVSYANYLNNSSHEDIKKFTKSAIKYGKYKAKLILEHTVKLGWSEQECIDSWGEPNKINTSTGCWGIHEQWVYEELSSTSYDVKFLYFENGILTSIQD